MRGLGMVELNKTQIAISVKSWKAPDKESDIYHNFLSKRTQMSNSLRAAEGLVHGGGKQAALGLRERQLRIRCLRALHGSREMQFSSGLPDPDRSGGDHVQPFLSGIWVVRLNLMFPRKLLT
jgi:hypothetical protein